MSDSEQRFDLLGDPIPPDHGIGRPPHIPTDEKRRIVVMLQAFDWSMERIAAALSITPPTLRKHYRRELKAREESRARAEASLINMLMREVEAGNVSAADKLFKRFDRLDLSRMADRAANRKPEPKLGKKEQRIQDAARLEGKFATPAAPRMFN